MSRHALPRSLMMTFLADALSARRITVEHLADLLAPTPEAVVRSWIEGSASPTHEDLLPLAKALRLHPVEIFAGWMIDQSPNIEETVRPFTLDAVGSRFPRQTDLALRAPRLRSDMNVGDPHDRPRIVRVESSDDRPVLKRAAGYARTVEG